METSPGNETLQPDIISTVAVSIKQNRHKQGALMFVLHEIQEHLGYIPYEAQKMIAEELEIPLSEVYSVVTFYSGFTLKPVGKYKCSVCMGTACYVKRANRVIAKLEEVLGIKRGETSADGKFSIDATRCIGACGLAPIMTINEDVYSKLVPQDIPGILAKYT